VLFINDVMIMKSVPLFQSFAHFPKLGKLESSKSYTTVSLARWRMDIAFVRFASRIVIKDTLFCFLKMTWKAIAIVVSKAHKAKDLATCSKVESVLLG
jgi:hypothetical protein